MLTWNTSKLLGIPWNIQLGAFGGLGTAELEHPRAHWNLGTNGHLQKSQTFWCCQDTIWCKCLLSPYILCSFSMSFPNDSVCLYNNLAWRCILVAYIALFWFRSLGAHLRPFPIQWYHQCACGLGRVQWDVAPIMLWCCAVRWNVVTIVQCIPVDCSVVERMMAGRAALCIQW